MRTLEKETLAYLGRGWSVVALRARAKRPATRWQEFEHRAPSVAEVQGWFRRWPDANVGIVTGRISDLVVVDVDPRHGGSESLQRLEAQHGALPETLEAVTGGGGRHLYFAHPGGVVRNRVGLAPGIDVRGDGGYIVAPPSLHPSGKRYAWVAGHDPERLRPAPMPRWLLHELRAAERRPGHSSGHWRQLARDGVGEGERNDSIASLAGHLLHHDVDPDVVLELLHCWNRTRCRPPLSDAEVERTVRSITQLHERAAAAPRGGDAVADDDRSAR